MKSHNTDLNIWLTDCRTIVTLYIHWIILARQEQNGSIDVLYKTAYNECPRHSTGTDDKQWHDLTHPIQCFITADTR